MASGFLNVRKPAGLTSHQCVGIIRKVFNTRQVGHGGTLDPMATGVLTVAVGRATRFLQFFPTAKEYRGVIRLGVTTDSDDITGEVLTQNSVPWVHEEMVRSTLQRFIGDIDQIPPRVSAIKKNGVRMYKLAREKKEFDVRPRSVHISQIEIEKFTFGDFPEVSIRVACGGGTYIRSIARECGEALTIPPEHVNAACKLQNPAGELCAGGTLTELERTRNGAFSIADSLDFDEIRAKLETGESPLLPIGNMLEHLPFTELSSQAASLWEKGSTVSISPNDVAFVENGSRECPGIKNGEYIRIYRPASQRLLGVSQIEEQEQQKFVFRKRLFI